MARKGLAKIKTAPRGPHADAVFTQLMITAMRIYGVPGVKKG